MTDFAFIRRSKLGLWLNEMGIHLRFGAAIFSGVKSQEEGGKIPQENTDHLLRQAGSGSSVPPKKPRRRALVIILFLLGIALVLCIGTWVFALYRARTLSNPVVTSTFAGGNEANCQVLIERAMQSSGDNCTNIDSNEVCYGNNTISASLIPGSGQTFGQRGDIIKVEELQSLSASPLNLASQEWGIAVFKVMANLPRSLPGETITMVVFGNTTLDKTAKNLETFYFSSDLGQIQCQKVPYDGIMITMPEGAGVKFTVNDAELTIMGNASLKATQNGSMEVSMYSGSAYIVSDGQGQVIGAGEVSSVPMGGSNGMSSTGPPSLPRTLSPEELAIACTMSGKFCSQQEITPVSADNAIATIQAQGIVVSPIDSSQVKTATLKASATALNTPTPVFTRIPSPAFFTPTFTRITPPTSTRTSTATRTRTPTATRTYTRTATYTPSPTLTSTTTPTHTSTQTSTATLTNTSTLTSTPTLTNTSTQTATSTFTATYTLTDTSTATSSLTLTSTNTPTDTSTPTLSSTPTSTNTSTSTNTATISLTPTNTNTPAGTCSNISIGNLNNPGGQNNLTLNITNNYSGTVTITSLDIVWNVATAVRLNTIDLAGHQISNPNVTTSPVNIPTDKPFTGVVGNRQITNGNTSNLVVNFSNNLASGSGYSIQIGFNIGCQIQASR
jgi:hypothetical protein